MGVFAVYSPRMHTRFHPLSPDLRCFHTHHWLGALTGCTILFLIYQPHRHFNNF